MIDFFFNLSNDTVIFEKSLVIGPQISSPPFIF